MKRSLACVSLILALILTLTACGSGNSAAVPSTPSAAPASSAVSADYAPSEWAFDTAFEMGYASNGTAENAGGGQSVYQNTDAKLIRRAELTIQTTEFEQAAAALEQMVSAQGGYFESASVRGGSYRASNANRWGEYVIRVPAEHYDAFLEQTGTLGYVTYKNESTENIGEQYYDVETRLRTQRTKQERLLSLLEKAETMEDIITLESALSDVEYQIEYLSSTLNRYDSLVGFATITLSLEQVAQVTENPGVADSLGTRIAAGFASSARGLVNGAQEFLVWVSYHIAGVAVFTAFVAFIVVICVRSVRRQKRKKAEHEKKEEEESE